MAKSTNFNAVSKKAGSALAGTGNFLKGNWQPLLYVGGAVIGIVLLRKLVKSISSFGSVEPERPQEAVIDDSKSTISESQARVYANQLFDAMNGYGTDEDTIRGVFEKLSPEDFKKVYNEYGRKMYTSTFIGGGTPTDTTIWLGDYENADLIYWLRKELNDITDRKTVTAVREVVEPAGFIF